MSNSELIKEINTKEVKNINKIVRCSLGLPLENTVTYPILIFLFSLCLKKICSFLGWRGDECYVSILFDFLKLN